MNIAVHVSGIEHQITQLSLKYSIIHQLQIEFVEDLGCVGWMT